MGRPLDVDLELNAAAPRVWRRVRVPSDLCLADLHRIIQAVMDWDDVHLHVFDVAGQEYGPEPDEEEISLNWAGDDESITIVRALEKGRGRVDYTYDFGSEQRVSITSSEATPAGSARIQCLDGCGADYDGAEVNRRLAAEFQAARAVDASLSLEDRLTADLSLLLLFLTSFEEGKGVRVANKTLRVDVLDGLSDAGLIVTNKYRKGVQLTPRGVKRAETLLTQVSALVQSSSE